MADILNLTILVAASLGALALGVFLAYLLLRLAFSWMAPRQHQFVPHPATQVAKASV